MKRSSFKYKKRKNKYLLTEVINGKNTRNIDIRKLEEEDLVALYAGYIEYSNEQMQILKSSGEINTTPSYIR